ncbi:NAD(P)-dependent oxidoreductase, partial [Yoonia sp.]|uniref:NAD(P)-dependent oxidoreductase n=1 Tax=Yoonia sp. TaxID=2212373 RepID=UPI0039771C26
MKVLADKYLYKLRELIPADADLELYDPDDGFPENAKRYDALLIRTVTKINEQTLPEPGKLAFIGSATAGFDHVDVNYLNEMGVTFARSEGCNANAVAEYVITALYKWAAERGVDLSSNKVGIVGCGNTGGRVAGYLKKLGVQTVLYDPPKAKIDDDFESSSEKELLECDILTFHTPLTNSNSYPTEHMCSEEWLKHGFSLIVNTA